MLSYLIAWCKKIDILLEDNVYDEDTILMLREVYNKVEDKIIDYESDDSDDSDYVDDSDFTESSDDSDFSDYSDEDD
tara:strand:+ start:463 stop:693 length:231 start_codon:yes stop_codon:yes gene_type:complete